MLMRASALRELLADKQLQRLLSQMETLPTLPSLYCEMVEALQSADASIGAIAGIVGRDVGMTAKILQMVNSAYFGIARKITCPIQAISLIGIDTAKNLVLSYQVFSQFDQTKVPKFYIDALWQHSMTVARYARELARIEGQDRRTVEDSFTAGLLHDAGKLALMANLPAEYAKALKLAKTQPISLAEAEETCIGANHAQVGAYLFRLWGLPETLVEAVAFHHGPAKYQQQIFSPLTAVHVANGLAHESACRGEAGVTSSIDLEYLAMLGLADRLPEWREICQKSDQNGNSR
jgi:putative nucleotidyltransferase with HDIG domain